MFATLHSREISVAALTATAAEFTPRFQVIGPLVLLDAAGISRLFGDAQELGRALHSAQPAARVALAGSAAASMILALAAEDVIVVDPGTEAAALAPLPIDLLAALAEARLEDEDQAGGDTEQPPPLLRRSAVGRAKAKGLPVKRQSSIAIRQCL